MSLVQWFLYNLREKKPCTFSSKTRLSAFLKEALSINGKTIPKRIFLLSSLLLLVKNEVLWDVILPSPGLAV